jgi:hypothetical protein
VSAIAGTIALKKTLIVSLTGAYVAGLDTVANTTARMRLYPIAVAQMRTANKDFVFEGHQIYEGEMMARVFYKLDLELESPNYVLKTKTAPTPGPAMDFKVRVKGYRHSWHEANTKMSGTQHLATIGRVERAPGR